MFDSILEAPLDLSITSISEPGPGLLVATSRMTGARALLAAIFGLACLGLCLHAWRHRADLWQVVWPHGALIPVFGAIALVFGFGHARKSFRAGVVVSSARLGPLAASKSYALPAGSAVTITLRKVYRSRAGGSGGMIPVRWYDVSVPGAPAAGFTVASDREAARAMARRLAGLLRSSVIDEVEDDGVERLKP